MGTHALLFLSLLVPAYMAYDQQGPRLVIAWALACAVGYLAWTDLPLRLAAGGYAPRTILTAMPRAALHLIFLVLGFLFVHKTVYLMVLLAMFK